ncbi:MAG: hypothetical protein JRJ14_09295, partial [Deltaproteobacteria bacterium]|nr:hypothetical protein [Deltaproteobacteria bacterium]
MTKNKARKGQFGLLEIFFQALVRYFSTPFSSGFDYHIQVEKHFYSVPYQQYGKDLDVRFNERIVEIFFKRKRVALHYRNFKQYGYTTA